MKWVLGVIVSVLLGWLAVWYFRGLLHLGYLDSAIGTVRTLVAAEERYSQSHPGVGYTCMLSELGRDQRITTLAKTGEWNGYAFEVTGCPNSIGPNRTYRIAARPLVIGMPAICSDQSGIVKTDESGSIQRCLTSGAPI